MATHLVISDCHAHPDYPNDRFDWLGKLILELKPDVIIDLGDRADMPSLCHYDKGKRGFEGKRYKNDIECLKDATGRIEKYIEAYNAQCKRNKKKGYHPRKVFCVVNHENRINRAIEDNAVLDGTISLDDLGLKEKGWEIVPYLTPIDIDGISYSHTFVSGVMGRPISSKYPAHKLLELGHISATMDHSHVRSYAESVGFDGRRRIGVVTGAFIDYFADYAGPQVNPLWWSGVLLKKGVKNGVYDHEWLSLEFLKNRYGKKNNPSFLKKRVTPKTPVPSPSK